MIFTTYGTIDKQFMLDQYDYYYLENQNRVFVKLLFQYQFTVSTRDAHVAQSEIILPWYSRNSFVERIMKEREEQLYPRFDIGAKITNELSRCTFPRRGCPGATGIGSPAQLPSRAKPRPSPPALGEAVYAAWHEYCQFTGGGTYVSHLTLLGSSSLISSPPTPRTKLLSSLFLVSCLASVSSFSSRERMKERDETREKRG